MVVHPFRRHPEFIGEFVHRFEAEWPAWYGPGGRGNARRDLEAFANTATGLPVGVVAIDFDGQACGVAALKATSIPAYAHLSPWAAAGYVLPELRGQGIGALLLAALVTEGRRMGYDNIYCATAGSRSLLQRSGWQLLEEVYHDGKPIALFKSPA